eukprot:CAMPEP_0116921930 /NCGR_PEP_ID=MMETSP0467-20121206/21942_1 /TAXON_ID=283647 /ORGANISM="Mesodinium pulex, Strain SPMC105" /LENGTH=122 /DNA_ID=CAMNT_0004600129 /DNA_START=377 /DNA_END=745 /DNA_ORIENTATION=-
MISMIVQLNSLGWASAVAIIPLFDSLQLFQAAHLVIAAIMSIPVLLYLATYTDFDKIKNVKNYNKDKDVNVDTISNNKVDTKCDSNNQKVVSEEFDKLNENDHHYSNRESNPDINSESGSDS